MKYTVRDLQEDFPDDAACLQWLVDWLYPEGITCKNCHKVTKHHRVKSRRSYSCDACGHHVHPTAGTIFHNSHVPLTDWFYAIWIMSANKAGTSATQIQRELGVSYQTAWRMMHQIRSLMAPPEELLQGEIEIDETYVHANTFKRSSARLRYGWDARRTGQVVFGMVERRTGKAKVWHIPQASVRTIMPLINANVAKGSLIHTDGWRAYQKLPVWGYYHKTTDHGRQVWVDPNDNTNYTQSVENLWSTMKPRMKGTFKHVTPRYLQLYVQEYAWRYSNRHKPSMFWSLMCRIEKL